MDANQQEAILRAIAVSSLNLYPTERANAFRILEDLKNHPNCIPLVIHWLHQERHVLTGTSTDITIATKLYCLELLQQFLKTGYSRCSEAERLTLRQAVLTSAQQHAPCAVTPETRILGNKIAAVVAGLVVRDFPQRWTTFTKDILRPTSQGGLWYNEGGTYNSVNQIGVRMCLEVFRLVAEDCTDSDFNAKISTTRRNDILIGFNEVSREFLPLFFQLLEHVNTLQQANTTLHNMRLYLINNNRGSLNQMTPEEANMYQIQLTTSEQSGKLLSDTLIMLDNFCRSMPLDWMIPSNSNNGGSNAGNDDGNNQNLDFIAAFMFLLRESSCQVTAVQCLEQVVLRGKLTSDQWFRLITELPNALSEVDTMANVEQEHLNVLKAVDPNVGEVDDPLIRQLPFYKSLARLLAQILSSYVSHITSCKPILNSSGPKFDAFSQFVRLVINVLRHPSGRIASEMVNTWIALLRDPQIVKAKLLQPFTAEILTCYMDHVVRIRWDDIDNNAHPKQAMIEASWDDEDEYDSWMGELRSKTALLFKFFGNTDPQTSSAVISQRVQSALQMHGNGEPHNYLHSSGNKQLTSKSDAIIQFEGLFQPLDAILGGIPDWALVEDNKSNRDRNRLEIRNNTRKSLSGMAQALVSWTPSYLWLKFRRTTLMDALKHYWKSEPSTLLQGIDSLLRYLSDPDEWYANINNNGRNGGKMSDEMIGLKKKAGVTLVAVSRKVPHHLVPYLPQLSEATRNLLSSQGELLAPNRMHLYEFLSVVATAVQDPATRSSFIEDVLSDAVNTLESPEVQESISSVPSFLRSLGITAAREFPDSVTNPENVKQVSGHYVRLFTAINQLLSVGKRCNEAARKRLINGESYIKETPGLSDPNNNNNIALASFPDEGPISIRDLAANDPFAPLWPRILPSILNVLDVTLKVWRPEHQAILLRDRIQRYAVAISDDEVFLSKNFDGKSGGVFGQGGTAGSVVPGTDRRDQNLVPKWSGWFNELRGTCFQILGLLAGSRALYAPELADFYPQFVAVICDPLNLKSMEHRHVTLFIKHFLEIFTISCPSTMYATHYGPIIGPVVEHMQDRLEKSWLPVLGGANSMPAAKALFSTDCDAAAAVASRGGDEWFDSYYARAGLFVGDVDAVTAESAVEKGRVEISRTFSDFIQSALALKGDWALVLATQAKEEQASRRNSDSSKKSSGPNTRTPPQGKVNADGTPKGRMQAAIDARKLLRISKICHFLLLENERIAGALTISIIQCLGYPDQYTCRRVTRIAHRILETTAWSEQYSHLLGYRMMTQVVKNIVTEPKWMVGVEWDMINVLRDIYCRLVLGQCLLPGGQGSGMQQTSPPQNPNIYEQAKSVDNPLHGGGILTTPSDYPRQVFANLPEVTTNVLEELEKNLKRKRGAKDQKDFIRDVLRVAADKLHEMNQTSSTNGGAAAGIFDRAVGEESLLHNPKRQVTVVPDLPEKLVTVGMMKKAQKKQQKAHEEAPVGLGAFHLF